MKVSSIEPLEARIAPAVLTITPVASSTNEGSTPGSTTNVQFKITLDTVEAQDVTVLATAFAGTALIGQDFAAFSQTIVVPKGQLEAIFSVPINQDTLIEGDETFSVKLSSPSANATLGAEGTETAVGTIANDDKPTLSLVGPAATPEGSTLNGKTFLTFTIKLDQKSSTPITVTARPQDGSATVNDGDFVGSDIEVIIPADVLEHTFTVPVNHDTKVEGTETFKVELVGDPTNAFIGSAKTATATITEDDPPTIKIVDASVVEGALGTSQLRFKVQLSGVAAQDVTFDWVTAAGTATAGVDFTNISQAIQATIAAGETEVELVVNVNGDISDELDETLSAFITNARMGSQSIVIADGTALGTIKNDEISVSLTGPGTVTEETPPTEAGKPPTITNANYTLTLSGVTNHEVKVVLEVIDGTAKAGSDFTLPTLLEVTIPANSVNPGTGTISIPIKIDQIFEGDETFEVRIKSVTNAIAGESDSVTTTILNDDTRPTLSVVDATVAEGNDAREVQVTVKLDGATEGPVTFDWSTVDGIAISGLDFEAVTNRTATIAAGATTTTLVLKLLGDTLWEGDETLGILLSNVSANAGLEPGNESGTVTIDENQTAPTLSIANASGAENSGTLTFVVSMPAGVQTSEDITFDWTAAFGTATAGVDYNATPTTVTIPAGQTSATFTVTLLDDAVLEQDETFQVNIGNAKFGPHAMSVPIGDDEATGRIISDERQVSISTGTLVISEQNGAQGETPSVIHYVISLTDALGNPLASDRDVTVTVALDEIASTAEANDITLPSNLTFTIPAGSTSVGFDVTVRGDVIFDGDEALVMKIADSTNASVRIGSATTTITDEETAPHLFIEDVKVAEGNSGIVVRKVKVKLTTAAEQDITFDWSTANGTALAGQDYTQNLSGKATIPAGATEVELDLVLSGDTQDEGDEHLFVNISNVLMGESTPVTVDDAQGQVTIHNDENVVRISGGTIQEGPGGPNLLFNVSMLQASTHNVTVTFALGAEGDTALPEQDYDVPEVITVTIPAGQTVATISIPIVNDEVSEALETFKVKLTDSSNATIAVAEATGTITDDDEAPVLSIDDVSHSEGNNGTTKYSFTIRLSEVSGQDVKVLVTPTAGTATSGAASDFTGQAQVITIPAGQLTAEATFDVLVNGDTRYEENEEFTVVLSNATGATIATEGNGVGTGTIVNDDPKPTLTVGNASINEGNGGPTTLTFEILLSGKSNLPVTFKAVTANGTAIAGTDYVARAEQTFTIEPGLDKFLYTVTLTGDAFFEQGETFFVNLTEITGAEGAGGNGTASGMGTIINDDAQPTISIADLTVTEGDGTTKEVEVTVSLSSLAGDDVTFDWSLPTGEDVTAILGQDFNTVTNPGTVTIPAGQNTAKIKFSIVGDTINELDETFLVKIENAKAGPTSLASPRDTAVVKLQNDEIKLNILDQTAVVLEGDSGTKTIGFEIKLSQASSDVVTVIVNTQDGTARSTGAAGIMDFDAITNQTVTFAAGETSKMVFVTIYGDISFDAIDQFKVLLSGSTNAAIVDGETTGTITEEANEARPVLTIKEDVTHVENAGESTEPKTPGKTIYTYTVQMDRYSDEVVEVTFGTVDGTAKAGSDFTAKTEQVKFLPGEAKAEGESFLTKTVTVEVLNDSLYELEESFKVALSNPLNGTLGTAKEKIGTIEVDGDVKPGLKVTSASLVEGDSGERFMDFVVQRIGETGADLTFTFATENGTAIAGTDYEGKTETITMTPTEASKTVRVKLLPDVNAEEDETFNVRLSTTEDGGVTIAEADGVATGTILDDDVKVSITPGTYSVSEGNAGQTDLVFHVQRTDAVNFPTTVTYTLTPGTATNTGGNPDFQTPTLLSVVIPAGQTAAEIRIPVVGDTTAEDNETFTVTLTGATNGELASTNTSATGNILNDDASLIISDGQLIEGADGTSNMVFTVTLKDATAFPVTVHYATSNGSAIAGTTAGSDYTATQGDLSFVLGGSTTLQILVPIRGDTTAEANETFTVTLSAASGATILDATATGTILDDESAHLSVGDASIEEGDNGQQNLVFKVSLTGTHTQPITVNYTTVDGTAKSAGPLLDYLSQNGTLTFAPGEVEKFISIPIFGDEWKEATEQFTVKLSNAEVDGRASGVSIDDDTATGQILDDGDATIGLIVNNGRVAEGNSGSKAMTFTIETTAPVTEALTFKASTRAGSAISSGPADTLDFTGISGQTHTIAAGTSSITVSVNVTGDTRYEGSEFFYLDITEFGTQVVPVDGGTERLSAFGVILNDDINIINGGREFEFTDTDGDIVRVKFSKGTLSVPETGTGKSGDTLTGDVSFVLDSITGGRMIELIQLSNDGLEFERANITITATPQILVTGEVIGTGKTQVGGIESMVLAGQNYFNPTGGVGLGSVKIDGDLGYVIAGSFVQNNGIRRLEVDQFGTASAPAQSVVFGPLGTMIVHGDFLGKLVVIGDALDLPFPGGIGKIGKLVIEGALKGGSDAGSGQIAVTHSIGNAVIGEIVGGAGDVSGLIAGTNSDFTVSIGKLTVLGDVVGGGGGRSGGLLFVDKVGTLSIGKLGKEAVSGSLIGGGGASSGSLGVGQIGSLLINGDIKGGAGEGSGLLDGTGIRKTRVEGGIIGGAGEGSGRINMIQLGSLSVDGSIQGGAGKLSGTVNATKSIDKARVGGDLIGGVGENAGLIVTGVLRGNMAIEGNIIGGDGKASGLISVSGYTENLQQVQGNAGSITIGKAGVSESGNVRGGNGDNSGKVFINGNLKSFLAHGNLEAAWDVPGEGEEENTTIVAKGAGVAGLDVFGTLRKAVIKGSIIGGTSEINSTTNRPVGSAFVAAGQIGSLTVEGSVTSGVKGTTSPSNQSAAFSAGIHANTTIDTLKILGSVGGNKDVPVVISAVGGIGNVTIGGDVTYAEILAGYNRSADLAKARGTFLNAGATINSVTVDGKWTASSLVAGVYAGTDGKFGTVDDTESANGTTDTNVVNVNLISEIAKVVIKGGIEAPTDAPSEASYAIVAEHLKSVTIGGIAESLTPKPKNDGRESEAGADKTQIYEIF